MHSKSSSDSQSTDPQGLLPDSAAHIARLGKTPYLNFLDKFWINF